jgi:hypothetical protein
MTDLQKLVEQAKAEAEWLRNPTQTDPAWLYKRLSLTAELLESLPTLAIQYAAEEAAKACEEHAASHEEDAELEKDERYAVYAKHERRCAAAIRERFKAL